MAVRLLAVAKVTFLESIRSKTLFTALLILGLQWITWGFIKDESLSIETAQSSVVKTLQVISHVGISFFALMIGVILAGTTLPRDMANRHLFFVFVKPISKIEFLFGKILGIWALVFLVALLALVNLMILVGMEASPDDAVTARSWTADIFSAVDGRLDGEVYTVKMPPWHLSREIVLNDDFRQAEVLEWTVRGPVVMDDIRYDVVHDGGRDQFILRHEDAAAMIEVADETVPVIVVKKGLVRLPLNEAWKRSETFRLQALQQKTRPHRISYAQLSKNEPPLTWRGSKIDDAFDTQQVAVVFDLTRSIPGNHFDVEVTMGQQTVRQTIKSRQKNKIVFDQLSSDLGEYPEAQFVLKGPTNVTLPVSSRYVYLEGATYGVFTNLWRGLGVSLLQVFIIIAITLTGSAFLTAPTAMLVGLTVFLFAHSSEALDELPEVMFRQRVPSHQRSPGGDLYVYDENALRPRTLRLMINSLNSVLPTFDRIVASDYFNRAEYIPMHVFMRELWHTLLNLLACLMLGAFVISRKEFLK